MDLVTLRITVRPMVAALAVLLVATAVGTLPRPAAAADSVWTAGTDTGGVNSSFVAAYASPTSAAAYASCFASAGTSWNMGKGGPFVINAMATDGRRVFLAGDGASALSCPISSLGTNCTPLSGPPMDGSEILSLAAAPGSVWLGRKDGKIYRCPTTGVDWNADARLCTVIDDAGQRQVSSLLWANGRLYAGLKNYGVENKKQGLLWTCDPLTANSCSTLDTYGNTTANSLAVGAGYLWAGLDNGIIWRCDPVKPNACDNWENSGGEPITSISYSQDYLYAVAGSQFVMSGTRVTGVLWSCPTATKDNCTTLFGGQSRRVDLHPSVAAGPSDIPGPSNVFWVGGAGADKRNQIAYSAGDSRQSYLTTHWNWGNVTYKTYPISQMLYLPADGPTGVGGIQVKATGIHRLGNPCTQRTRLPLRLTATSTTGHTMRRVVNLCRAHRAGDTTLITPITTLLDPGTYTLTARTQGFHARKTVTVTKNTTTRTTVRLATRGRG